MERLQADQSDRAAPGSAHDLAPDLEPTSEGASWIPSATLGPARSGGVFSRAAGQPLPSPEGMSGGDGRRWLSPDILRRGAGGSRSDGSPAGDAAGWTHRGGVAAVLRRSADGADPLGGTEVAPAIADALRRRRGSGTPLERVDAQRFGRQLGTDVSGVRVHTDSEADSIARSVQATAFTHGSDIYFTRGSYSPDTPPGDHLLAHELAHVVQGSIGASGGASVAPMIGKADDPTEAAADRIADSVTNGLRRKTFDDTSAGVAAVTTVAGGLRRQRDPDTIHRSFGKAKKMVKALFGKAKPVDDVETGDDYIDDMTHEEKLEHNRRFRGSGPGENPDYTNPALFGEEPDEWKVTLAVAQEDTKWLQNVKDLKKVALKELASSPRRLFADLGKAQEKLVKKTLMSQYDLSTKTSDEVNQLVEEFTDGIRDVGHTWVRLSTHVGGRLKELYTYGMWPQKLFSPGEDGDEHGGYAGPIAVGPGEVRHPDVKHEDDAAKAYKHYAVTEKDFNRALDTAIERYNNPPPYVLTGYNCTAFAREIVQAAGKSYPGKGLLPGFAYTPGDLYWAIMKEWVKGKKTVALQDSKEESAAMGKLKARADTFAEAGKDNVEGEYKTATFELPPPGQKRARVTLYAGSTITYGWYPSAIDQEFDLDVDTEYTMINDRAFIDEHDAVPVELGAQIVFFDADDFNVAIRPPKKKATPATVAPPVAPVSGYQDGGKAPGPASGYQDGAKAPASASSYQDAGSPPVGGSGYHDGPGQPSVVSQQDQADASAQPGDGAKQPGAAVGYHDGGVQPVSGLGYHDGGVQPVSGLGYHDSGAQPATGSGYHDGGAQPVSGLGYHDSGAQPATGSGYHDSGGAANVADTSGTPSVVASDASPQQVDTAQQDPYLSAPPAKDIDLTAPMPAAKKNRRAWIAAALGSNYQKETESAHATYHSSMVDLVTAIGAAKNAVELLRNGKTVKEAARVLWASNADRVEPLAKKLATLDEAQALQAATETYEELLELAKRQEIPLTNDLKLADTSDRRVHYDSKKEQQESKVRISGGKLIRNSGEPVDTKASSTFFSGNGVEIFVAGVKGDLHMASQKIGKYHHSSLLAGADVAIGGEMRVAAGKIEWMTNKSGHYRPSRAHLLQFLKWLAEDGVDVNFPVRGNFLGSGVDLGDAMTGATLLTGMDNEGKVDLSRGFDALNLTEAIDYYREHHPQKLKKALSAKGWKVNEDGTAVINKQQQRVDAATVRKHLESAIGRAQARTTQS